MVSTITGGGILSLSMSGDGQKLLAGHSDDYAYFYDSTSSNPIWKFDGGNNDHQSVSISKDGKNLVIANQNHNIYTLETSNIKRPSAILYSPSNVLHATVNLSMNWFYGSDDIDNLTFDLYLDNHENADFVEIKFN